MKPLLAEMSLCVALSLLALLQVGALDSQWEEWKIHHRKTYHGDESYRRSIWEQNMRRIATHNQEAEQGQHSYKLGVNALTDMTSQEVTKKLMCLKRHTAKFSNFSSAGRFYLQSPDPTGPSWKINAIQIEQKSCSAGTKLPKSIDHRQEGLVTSVRIQGACGSCWAFSAAGALEGQLAKKTGRLLELSPQNLLDCVTTRGCAGGHMIDAFEYVQKGGINSEEDYPYVEKKQPCRFNPSAVAAQCTSFRQIPEGDEWALAEALWAVGPLSVAIDFGHISITSYTSGVFYSTQCNSNNPNHAMLLVGYGETVEGQQFWILKNSWGEDWGEKGYIRLARNRDNHCGIATDASYPLM